MGWGNGENFRGDVVGYAHDDVCNADGCDVEIDRGLAYCCGDLEGVRGEDGCGYHFCHDHLYMMVGLRRGEDEPLAGPYCPTCARAADDLTEMWEAANLPEDELPVSLMKVYVLYKRAASGPQ